MFDTARVRIDEWGLGSYTTVISYTSCL